MFAALARTFGSSASSWDEKRSNTQSAGFLVLGGRPKPIRIRQNSGVPSACATDRTPF